MPEIWLSYGPTEVVLDIKAENLERQIGLEGTNLSDSGIASKLQSIDLQNQPRLLFWNPQKLFKK